MESKLYTLKPPEPGGNFELRESSFQEANLKKKIVVLIHGIEYHSPQCILSDLVEPFLRETSLKSRLNADELPQFFIYHWKSTLDFTDKYRLGTTRATILQKGRSLLNLREELTEVEDRARRAGQQIAGDIYRLCRGAAMMPTIVTHSMGGLVWSTIANAILKATPNFSKLGTWWNLQPAIPSRSLEDGGEFSEVGAYYERQGKMTVVFSKFDLVLGTLYLMAKRDVALGQVGCKLKNVRQFDASKLVREAHGQIYLMSSRGCFFQRIRQYLTTYRHEILV